MNREFIEQFNQGDFLHKAKLVIEYLSPEPDQHLAIPLKPGGKYDSVHFTGYVKQRCGLFYVSTGITRVPLFAFHLYPDGERSFNSFLKMSNNHKFAELAKRQFIEAFDGLIQPNYVNN